MWITKKIIDNYPHGIYNGEQIIEQEKKAIALRQITFLV